SGCCPGSGWCPSSGGLIGSLSFRPARSAATSSSRATSFWSPEVSLLDLIFPPRCGGCGAYGAPWCAACAGTLRPPSANTLAGIRATPAQVGLSQAERRANLAGAFRWSGPQPSGDHLGLVDDVCTTGATLTSAAEAVAEAGGSIGAFLVLAVAQTLPAVAVT